MVLRSFPLPQVTRTPSCYFRLAVPLAKGCCWMRSSVAVCHPSEVVVDPRAVVVTRTGAKQSRSLQRPLGARRREPVRLFRRMLRRSDVRLAQHSQIICGRVRIESVAPLLHEHLDRGGQAIIEGTQGFGLSLLHGPGYPHLTARDTTAAGFASEVGLSRDR